MIKKSFISILALLCLTVSGAWAAQETLLTTILSADNTDFTSGSKTFDNKVTVEISDYVSFDNEYGWYSDEGTLTVTAAVGYTINRVKFYTNNDGSGIDVEAPFEAILVWDEEGPGNYVKVNGSSIGQTGVTKIEVYGSPVAVTGVTLAPTSATLTLGETETVTLTATVAPGDAKDKSVTWSSSNEAVATVSNKGVVTAVAVGEATITVTTTDGAKTATCAVTVAAPELALNEADDNTGKLTEWDGYEANVTLTRNITAGNWSTIVLPFAMTAAQLKEAFGDDVKVAELTSGDATTLNFTALDLTNGATTTTANQPYAIKVGTTVSEAKTISGVTIVEGSTTQSLTDWDFVGTYESGNIPDGSYFFSGNKLWQASGDAVTIKPFRAYFTPKVAAARQVLFVIEGEEGETSIGRINADGTMETVAEGPIFNLAGQRVANPSKGLYIVNGKKVIIK